MASAATVNLQMTGGWTMNDGATSGGLGVSPNFSPSTTPNGTFNATNGTSTGNVNVIYKKTLSIAASGSVSIDMTGGGGELDMLNLALSIAKVRWLYLEITTPGASTALKFGPQAQTNAWQGPWGGVGATNLSLVPHIFHMVDNYDNWSAVDGTHKVLYILNSGAATVAGTLLVGGHS